MIELEMTAPALETTLHLWRTAAEAVATDSIVARREAYEAIIAVVRDDLLGVTTVATLVAAFGRAEMHGTAIRASLRRYGKVLNAEVIVAAACWQHLRALIAQEHGAGDTR